MRILITAMLGLVSHSAIAHEGSIFASEHMASLGLALMALGILLATIATAIHRTYPSDRKAKQTKKAFMKRFQDLLLTLMPINFSKGRS